MLLDTSGIYCLADSDEVNHATAVSLFGKAPVIVQHNYILAEWYPLARKKGMHHRERTDWIYSILANQRIRLYWVDELLHGDAVALLEARTDKEYSLCDAVSFVLMLRLVIWEALTTDHHFEQEGFVRLLKD